jgi:hypothetical protein|mmetsp:Transcript_19729/g.61246  ORF Transcript_19729/g.61246 Transcript_19729/m.61246 type:complete len:113 (+) Transcript_19729:75-413(+)
MGGKAKPTKHTSKELKNKEKAATQNKGGGKHGAADRKGGKAGHAKFECYICMMAAPSIKTMEIHFDSKHPKETFDAARCTNKIAANGGVTTSGVAVKGSIHQNNSQKRQGKK